MPRIFEGVSFAVKPDKKCVGHRWEYEMLAPPAERVVSFIERKVHVDEFDSVHYTYFGDSIVSNWD